MLQDTEEGQPRTETFHTYRHRTKARTRQRYRSRRDKKRGDESNDRSEQSSGGAEVNIQQPLCEAEMTSI